MAVKNVSENQEPIAPGSWPTKTLAHERFRRVNKAQRHILFALGRYHERYSSMLMDKPLQAALSKGAFIELLTNAGLAGKKERALYKNLEDLEEARLTSYEHKTLIFTDKGRKEYTRLVNGLDPYFRVVDMLSKTNVLKLTNKTTMQLKV